MLQGFIFQKKYWKPLELSQLTKYLLDRGAVVTAKLTSTHYRRSVLVQRGLEIPCQVKAEIIATEIIAYFGSLSRPCK